MQGVAYLLLQKGYNLMSAIQDAMNEQKFKYVWTLLTKVSNDEIVKKTNEEGQNLFHTFAIKGGLAPFDLTKKIHKTFINKGISFTLQDKFGKTPLHYAANSGFLFLIKELLNSGVDPNVQDKSGLTAFSIQLIEGSINEHSIQPYIQHNANFALKFKIKVKSADGNEEEFETGPLVYLASKGSKNYELMKLLINHGVSVNETDEDGRTPLMNAIRGNKKKLVKFFLNFAEIDKNQSDNDGKTPIHHVVCPMERVSFENTEILEILAKHFDINKTDETGKPPIYYAHLQDSGVMAAKLIQLGAKDEKPNSNVRRAATSVVASIAWSADIDFEDDAESFLKQAQEAEKEIIVEEKKVEPDQGVENREIYEVVYDQKLGPYDLYMTKVDIQAGQYGGNKFYKMQVVRQTNRDVYVLFTRWGRIGDFGQHQHTPQPTKEKAIEEFCKIFKSKSGNEWEKRDEFKKQPGKYQLLNFTNKRNAKEYLVPFDLKNPNVPKPKLDKDLRPIIEDISNMKMFQATMQQYHIDTTFLPLTNLTKELLNEAQQILFEIKEYQEEIEAQRKLDNTKKDLNKMIDLHHKIAEKSSRFYELIPDSRYRMCPVPSIEYSHQLSEKSNMLNSLLDFEISSKILLGALHNTFKINPLDYCFQALNVRTATLSKEDPEYKIIQKYTLNSHPGKEDFIINVFAIERKSEAERIQQWSHLKNRMLLWHGSKLSNFMGILSQGLRVAPPEAPATGYAFGKGIYFADMFEKSYGYTSDWNVSGGDYRLLLLCEVALGEMLELENPEFITELKAPYKSTKGLGVRGPKPNKKVVLPNGCQVPIGKIVDLKKDKNNSPFNYWNRLNHNEYIVYNNSQVRMRYLVQVKSS